MEAHLVVELRQFCLYTPQLIAHNPRRLEQRLEDQRPGLLGSKGHTPLPFYQVPCKPLCSPQQMHVVFPATQEVVGQYIGSLPLVGHKLCPHC